MAESHKISLIGLVLLLALAACSPAGNVTPTVQGIINTTIPTVPVTADTATATIPPLQTIKSPSFQSLDMLDANNGWGFTDNAVVRTSDGGATWYIVLPVTLGGVPATSYFLNATTAWVVVPAADPTHGTLFHTTDGGINWTSAQVPFGGGSIKFVDPMNGWELVGLSAGMSHEAVAIFRTTDGGTTWSQVFINDPNAPATNDSLPLVGDKNGITALDASHGWVTGAQPSGDFIYVYMTQDGGTTWSNQNLAIPAGYNGAMTSANLPVFFGSSQGVLPVLYFANNNGADFYISQDGGQTWSFTNPVPQGGFLTVASVNDFFVWDGSAPLYASHDAGKTWSTITPNINVKDNMVSLQFVDASTGWVLTSDASSHYSLYKTSDGGLTWETVIP